MTVHNILRMGDTRLLRRAQPVQAFDTDALHTLVRNLWQTMEAAQGVGLAAPQIGVDLQVMVFGVGTGSARYPDRPSIQPTVLINPVLTLLGIEEQDDWEGCLSVPGLRAVVPRAAQIRYQGLDPYGDPIDRHAQGFHARVVQHEYDHLQGVLYPMRVRDFTRFGFADTLPASAITIKNEGQCRHE